MFNCMYLIIFLKYIVTLTSHHLQNFGFKIVLSFKTEISILFIKLFDKNKIQNRFFICSLFVTRKLGGFKCFFEDNSPCFEKYPNESKSLQINYLRTFSIINEDNPVFPNRTPWEIIPLQITLALFVSQWIYSVQLL